MYMYLNGAELSGVNNSYSGFNVDWGVLILGASSYSTVAYYGLKGYIDEFRIVKGARMWTADFSSEFANNPPGPYCAATLTGNVSMEESCNSGVVATPTDMTLDALGRFDEAAEFLGGCGEGEGEGEGEGS